MDFIYEKLRAGTTVSDSDSGSEVARKFNENFENTKKKFLEIEDDLEIINDKEQKVMCFSSIEDAEKWAETHDCSGYIFSIQINEEWIPYIVQNDNTLITIKNSNMWESM